MHKDRLFPWKRKLKILILKSEKHESLINLFTQQIVLNAYMLGAVLALGLSEAKVI